jgi:hypothetical protein
MLVAGGLVGLNVLYYANPDPSYDGPVKYYGWPWFYYSVPRPEPLGDISPDVWKWKEFIIDMAIAMAILLAAGCLSEFLVRRFDRRKGSTG